MDGSSPAGRVAAKIREKGAAIILRRVTRSAGASPLVNPPETEDLLVDGNWPAGSSAIALRSSRTRGRLLRGDMLLLPAEEALVAAETASRPTKPNGFSAIPLQAPTTVDLVDGAFVSLACACDLTTFAMINAYPKRVVDGERIRASDLAVMISAFGLPEPQTTWQLWFAGRQFSIESVTPTYQRASVVHWTLQAR